MGYRESGVGKTPENFQSGEPAVILQMRQSLSLRQDILVKRHPEKALELENETRYLSNFYTVGLQERIHRAEDVESEEVAQANEIANRVLRFGPYRIGCIDERNKYEYVFGFPPGVGGDYRVPAGNPTEFLLSSDGSLGLDPDSNYAKAFDRLLVKQNCKLPELILDCHLDCKAQDLAESVKKPSPLRKKYSDHGLLQDVRRKIEMSEAIRKYAGRKHYGKPVDMILTSYDPETNYMYMGLEQDEALAHAETNGGYTHQVLERLAGNKILSTQHIVADPRIQSLFEKYTFIPDWKEGFKATTLQYWRNVESLMSSEVADIIREQVNDVYGDKDPEKNEDRVQLLLLNSYSGFLNNQAGIVVKEHNANTVIVSERQYGAFAKVAGFQVSSHSSSIPEDVNLAVSIVQKNREKGTASDITDTFEDYTQAPHAVMLQKIDRENSPIWSKLQAIDFSDLARLNWRTMSESDFTRYLKSKYQEITVNACEVLNYLRENAAAFLDPAKPTAQQIMEGDLHLLSMVTDTNRRPIFVLPLEYGGYDL